MAGRFFPARSGLRPLKFQSSEPIVEPGGSVASVLVTLLGSPRRLENRFQDGLMAPLDPRARRQVRGLKELASNAIVSYG